MKRSTVFSPTLAIAAIALGLSNTGFAQATTDAAATAPATTTLTTTVTTPAASTIADSDSMQARTPAAASAGVPTGAIGSTGLDRADSSNVAFARLDMADRGFLSRSDVSQLPGFGDAFAQADRDRDGRLDRTEFTDAWALYLDQAAARESTVPTTPTLAPAR